MAASGIKSGKFVVLKEVIPSGLPQREHFGIEEKELPPLEDGGVLLQTLVMSPDPYLRQGMKLESGLGVLRGFLAGKVLESKSDKWVAGDLFGANLPFGTFQVLSQETLAKTSIWKLTGYIEEDKISYGVGVLGMPGSTAYAGIRGILRTKENETIFVSGAAGAVGGLVGQIAKNVLNCTVIGSCGGEKKGELIKTKFGFDHAIDYKTVGERGAEELTERLKKVAPEGIDMYFENVGGMHFEAAMACMRAEGRVAVCGTISSYNSSEPQYVKLNVGSLIYPRIRIEGFLCFPWLSGQKGNFLEEMSGWLKEGKIQVEETYFDGVESWVDGFQSLFTGGNTGKVVVRI